MAWRPHPRRAATDSDDPRAWATCDQSGFVGNLRDFQPQYQWAGNQLINLRFLVHPDFLDQPQEQLRTLVLPPDPSPLFNARPEPYAMDETNWRTVSDGSIRSTSEGDLRVTNTANPDTASAPEGEGSFGNDFGNDFS